MSSKASEIPHIVITEPSTSIQNPPIATVTVQESAFTSRNGGGEEPQTSPAVICSPPELDAASIASSEQIPPLTEAEKQNEDEFSPPEERNGCVIRAHEHEQEGGCVIRAHEHEQEGGCVIRAHESRSESEEMDNTTGSSESDADEFRTSRCSRFDLRIKEAYLYMSDVFGSRYSITFWMILMALPLSAGIMGSSYMFSCPACVALPNTVFMMGISMVALLTFHVCIIIHRFTSENENFRLMLRTLKLICMFITTLLYLTESVSYWRMESSPEEGTPKYCHPTFTTYAFWWNIATSVLLAVIILFPMA